MVDTAEKEFRICLVGAGGVGTIAALVLEKSNRANVTVVLRSAFQLVSERGWDIESVDHGSLRGWKPSRGMSCDKVLLCYDFTDAFQWSPIYRMQHLHHLQTRLS